MTFRPSAALLPALVLAACGGAQAAGPGAADWRAALRDGDGIGAEIALKRELDAGTAPASIAAFLGEAELQQGDLGEAERWLRHADFSPQTAGHGFAMLGRLRMQQGDLAAAGHAFDKALAAGNDGGAVWVDIGRLRWRGGEQIEAVEASRIALQRDASLPAAILFRAQLLRDSEGHAAALPLLERGLALAPGDPAMLGEYAATLGELGRNRDMLAAVRQLAKVAPSDRKVLWLQAVLAARAGQYDLARSLLQRGGDLDREMPAAILLLAIIDGENGNHASAAQGFDRLLRAQPDNARVARLLARSLSLGGNHRELIARFSDRKGSPYFAQLLGRAHEALGEREKAAVLLDGATAAAAMTLSLLPTDLPAEAAAIRGGSDGPGAVGLVRSLLAAGRESEAEARAGAFLGHHRGSADALGLAGDAALEAGRTGLALARYRAAASVRRTWPLARRMVVALDRMGDRKGATGVVERHLAGEPGNADAAAMLARRTYGAGEAQRAASLARRALALGRNDAVLVRIAAGG